MKLTSDIQAYSCLWPAQYASEAARMATVLGEAVLAMHHVGSTAVPHLAAKPEIDILAVVSAGSVVHAWQQGLQALGYQRGSDLSAGHSFFKRDVDGVRTHKLHLCVAGHREIGRMLDFRDALRNDEGLRLAYQALKLQLEATNTRGIGEYLEKKAPFIEAVLQRRA